MYERKLIIKSEARMCNKYEISEFFRRDSFGFFGFFFPSKPQIKDINQIHQIMLGNNTGMNLGFLHLM